MADGPEWKSFPADPTVVEATSADGAKVDYTLPTAVVSKPSATVSVACAPAPGALAPLGKTEVRCTAVSPGGDRAVRTFTVIVRDTTPPAISGVPGEVEVASTGQTTPVGYQLPTASDLVSGSLPVTCTPAPGAGFPLGSTNVKCSAKDKAGNAATASFTVVVTADRTAPAIASTNDLVVEAQGKTTRVDFTPPAAKDDVDGPVQTTCTPGPGSSFALGRTPVKCEAKDASGNVAASSFAVVVRDTTAPALSGAADLTREATGPAGTRVEFPKPTAVDAVDGTIAAVSCTPASDLVFALGRTAVTCKATDSAGNTGSARFDVVVTDTTAPVLSVPEPLRITKSHANGVPRSDAAIAAFLAGAKATDLVDGALPATSEAPAIIPLGPTAIVFSAVDRAGNRAQTQVIVTVALEERTPVPAAGAPTAPKKPPPAPASTRPAAPAPRSPEPSAAPPPKPATPPERTEPSPERKATPPSDRIDPEAAAAPERKADVGPVPRKTEPVAKPTRDRAKQGGARQALNELLKGDSTSPLAPIAIAGLLSIMLGLFVWAAIRSYRAAPLESLDALAPDHLPPFRAGFGATSHPATAQVAALEPGECEIALWEGFTKSQFYARGIGPDGEEVAFGDSPAFRMGSSVDGEPDTSARAAHEELLRRLSDEGWTVTGANGTWYSLRLSRSRD